MTLNADHLKKIFISTFIITILGLQFMPILTEGDDNSWSDYYWPFTHYPMYNGAHQEGDYVKVGSSVTATLTSGEKIIVNFRNARELGLNFFMFQDLCALLSRPDGYLYAAEFTEKHSRGDEMAKLEIYNYPVIVTRDGPKEVEAKLLNSIILIPFSKGAMQ